MSNLWFNVRFGVRHWQWGPDGMTFQINPHQVNERKSNPYWKWFAIYTLFGHH